MSDKIELWQPSNGTIGAIFIADWCGTCARDIEENCDICSRTMIFNITAPEYPKEWRYDNNGNLICTAYIPEGEAITDVMRDDRTIDMFEEKE